ncbi:MAG TPA: Usg family protein [Rhodopila sp.]|uniref:usg protein n=1 Tax=Rhodopila sp. TaxID=2480087 RepID=UPI002CEB02EF|nr:Usg family protein [Rhodopila sp.]HVY17000.1 Usg family protein [Rhodopila sp.]
MSLAFKTGAPRDYRLTTAEILYRLPDHPNLLQSFIWQDVDIAPRYPVLNKFLDFWRREIEGDLHSVRVASVELGRRGRLRHADTLLRIH